MKDAIPFYKQIYDNFRRDILDGRMSPGMRLPASRRMAESLGVSRMTVVNAYDQLLAEGYLEARQGSGTFVASTLPEEFLRVQRLGKMTRTGSLRRNVKLSRFGENLRHESAALLSHHSPTAAVTFQHGLIATDEFPFDLWAKISQKHLKYSYRHLGNYDDAAGYRPLRSAIAHHLRSTRGVRCDDEQVIVTSGTQQAVFLIAKILLVAGDKVWLEDPCHLGTSDVMRAFGMNVDHISVDEEGFDLDKAKKSRRSARIVYATPSRQFPLGMTMSLQRRLNLLEWAKGSEAWIIEDDYDSEFRYSGRPLPSLQGLDRDGRVLYVGTFSKTVFPALRLGCLVVPSDLIDIFTAACALNNLHAPITDQMVLTDFIADGHFERHVRRMRTLYRTRQETLVEEVQKHLSGLLEVSRSDAGMHVIGWLPKGNSDEAISQKVSEQGLRAASVSRYSLHKLNRGGLLLGYTAFNEKEIRSGVKKLARGLQSDNLL